MRLEECEQDIEHDGVENQSQAGGGTVLLGWESHGARQLVGCGGGENDKEGNGKEAG